MVLIRSVADDDSAPIYFEVAVSSPSESWGDDERRNRALDKVVETSVDVLDRSVELARNCAARFREGLRELSDDVDAPDEVSLDLSIKLDAEAGAVLAKAAAGAEFHVTLTWRKPDVTSS